MCGRYACVVQNLGRWGAVFKVLLEEIDDKYNIAPSAMVQAFTRNGWSQMRWGLIPSWAKEPTTKYATFNARAESLIEKPVYRGAWKAGRRCLIPVSGYYEWKVIEKKKRPFYITSTLDEPLVLAGLFEKWGKGADELFSCTIITTASHGELTQLHHRMPVMLEPEQAESWLTGTRDDALDILQNPSINNLHYYEVASDVGNSRQQGKRLIEPLC